MQASEDRRHLHEKRMPIPPLTDALTVIHRLITAPDEDAIHAAQRCLKLHGWSK